VGIPRSPFFQVNDSFLCWLRLFWGTFFISPFDGIVQICIFIICCCTAFPLAVVAFSCPCAVWHPPTLPTYCKEIGPDLLGSVSLASIAGAISILATASPEGVQVIKDLITQMLADVTTQHNIVQVALNNMSAYATCGAAMSAAIKNATLEDASFSIPVVSNTEATATVTSGSSECEKVIAALNSSLASCRQEESVLSTTKEAVCQRLTDVDMSTSGAIAYACHEQYTGTYEHCLSRNMGTLATYRQREQECSDVEQALAETAQCGAIQDAITAKRLTCIVTVTGPVTTTTVAPTEAPSCDPYHRKVTACNIHEDYYAAATSGKEEEYDSGVVLEQSRQVMWIFPLEELHVSSGWLGQTATRQSCSTNASPSPLIHTTSHTWC